jgi:3-oxoacyl-[acyl-carrier-protein] synthase II
MEGEHAESVSARAAFVAGRGAVSCFGAGRDALLDGVFAGRTGIRPLERLASASCLAAVAAEVPADVHARLAGEESFVLALALHAAREALRDARLEPLRRTDGPSLGLVLATTKADLTGGMAAGNELGSPWRLLARVAEHLGIAGRSAAVSCACASGLSALALGASWIRSGALERVLVVGADALNEFILRGFSSLLALDPGPCRPFDRTRAGLSLGEGAGAIVLSARERESLGVELVAWGASNDANHITGPCRDGSGLALAVQRALWRAGSPRVDYVHLHGTGTEYNDAMECRALRAVFSDPPVASGSKAQLGHTLGAAGVLESLVAIEALRRAQAPPNVGLCELDPELGLPLVSSARPLPRASVALKLAAGFGGINSALVFSLGPPGSSLASSSSSSFLPLAEPQDKEPGWSLAVPGERSICITAGGAVDRIGFAGTSGVSKRWSELGLDPLADKLRWKALFPAPFPDFRHLDRLSKMLCIAAESAGLTPRVPPPDDYTALLFASAHGCLDSDWRFEQSLGSADGTAAGLFPYTLSSTCLGAVAIRYGLRGPTLSLSTPPGQEGRAIREAAELVARGEAARCVLFLGDWVAADATRSLQIESRALLVALVLEPGDPGASSWPAVSELLRVPDPVPYLIDHLRARHSHVQH